MISKKIMTQILGGKDKEENLIMLKGHAITIIGNNESGWYVYDPYGKANSDYKNEGGKYVCNNCGKWNVGISSKYTLSIPEEN
ncbi:hypothetical protein [Leptospira jelokensis]|uniref:hypothetical protein n=1 Tax=Leptospira jelokensis TaxID=2484931 RepID=UPI0010915886|nr:hypothetical protein [Leptospira jelokensis]TGM02405.1 hypothetical protein EHQ79_13625 [Leptospira jelokensis]